MPEGDWQRIVIDQDICIGCAACVAVCPYQALEMDSNAKAVMIWEKCKDSFDCIPVCPVTCIWKSGETPAESKPKDNWLKFAQPLTPDQQKEFDAWKGKYNITGKPAQ